MAATPHNKCRIPGADGTPCHRFNPDCPHTTIDTVLAGLQLGSVTPPPGEPLRDPDDPVPLPPSFPAAPAEACATIVVCGHEIEIVLRDTDESRLLARMGELIRSCCEGDEEHYGGEEDGEDDMN